MDVAYVESREPLVFVPKARLAEDDRLLLSDGVGGISPPDDGGRIPEPRLGGTAGAAPPWTEGIPGDRLVVGERKLCPLLVCPCMASMCARDGAELDEVRDSFLVMLGCGTEFGAA